MSWSGREAISDVRECSGDPPGCLGVFGMPFQGSRSGREDFPDVREWSGGPPGSPGVVGMQSRMSGSGKSPSRMSGSSQKALPDV